LAGSIDRGDCCTFQKEETMASDAAWDKALADAKKVLGNSAKVSDKRMQVTISSAVDANKLWDAFNAMREAMKKKLLDLQNAESKVKNSLVQADDEISDDDYGLDPKKPDDKKKIDQAQAIFSKFFKEKQKNMDDNIKNLDELDKHLMDIQKYKRA
jgi:hypothetical protein